MLDSSGGNSIAISIAMFFWLSYAPIAVLSLYRALRNRKVFVEKDLPRTRGDDSAAVIIFQITTRSATKTPVVRRGILSVHEAAVQINYSSYQVSVVTDDPSDLQALRGCGCEVVVVDRHFATDAIKKGRALQYAVEHRRRAGRNTPEYWVFHMDDESCVTAQTLLALLKFVRKGRGVASEGPIFYPLKFESAGALAAIAESIRPFACYDCVSQMTSPPPLHMHGSNLLVRSDVEDAVEWKFGPTLAEDQMFGFKVYERYGPGSMGWHGGMLLEQPPLNLRDHFFQRRRWVLGTLQNMASFPPWHRFKLMFKSVTYFLGFASAVTSMAFWVYNYAPVALSLAQADLGRSYAEIGSEIGALPARLLGSLASADALASSVAEAGLAELGTGALLLFTSIVWLASYQAGLFLNLRHSKIKQGRKLLFHIQALVLCPVIGLVETFPAFWATIEYYIRKKKEEGARIPVYDFYVVSK